MLGVLASSFAFDYHVINVYLYNVANQAFDTLLKHFLVQTT